MLYLVRANYLSCNLYFYCMSNIYFFFGDYDRDPRELIYTFFFLDCYFDLVFNQVYIKLYFVKPICYIYSMESQLEFKIYEI